MDLGLLFWWRLYLSLIEYHIQICMFHPKTIERNFTSVFTIQNCFRHFLKSLYYSKYLSKISEKLIKFYRILQPEFIELATSIKMSAILRIFLI